MFQSEAKREIIDTKWLFYFHANETHFHNQSSVLSLVYRLHHFVSLLHSERVLSRAFCPRPVQVGSVWFRLFSISLNTTKMKYVI